MNSFDAMTCFTEQIRRAISFDDFNVKVITTPSPVDEKGMVVKVTMLKTFKAKPGRNIRLRLSVCGAAESDQGIKDALTAIERIDDYLENPRHLEDPSGNKIVNTRIIQAVTEEDSFFTSPDDLQVQEVDDNRIVTITIPIN